MKKEILIVISVLGIVVLVIFIGVFFRGRKTFIVSPAGELKEVIKDKPLEKYSFENLKRRGGVPSQIELARLLNEDPKFTAYLFYYYSNNRKITGLANVPKGDIGAPVIIMLRGFVEKSIYQTGMGTRPAGEVYAANGFLTLSPDYLGYGESENPPENVWEERFLRHVAVQDLIASVRTLNQANPAQIFLWGHSNGGMEALTALELSGEVYPTVLWAPVSEYFPYDVLYYTYEFEDQGRQLRKALADFEKDYEAVRYSNDRHYDWIKAPIQIQQGTSDPYIPLSWTNKLVKNLKEQNLEIIYNTYPGSDHNLRPAWDRVVQTDLVFFRKYL